MTDGAEQDGGQGAPPRVLLIAGPTASGKSAAALAVAEAQGGEIVNADSMQVYRDLRILTARPSPEDEARAPHHLYGVLDGAEACSAARWAAMAGAAIEAIVARGRLPIVVGGTGLYFRALTEGLAAVPDIPGINREAARVLVEELGPEAAHAHLSERDPETAARIRPTDPQRVARALEVLAATGRGLAAWQADPPAPALNARFVRVVLTPPRAVLAVRAAARLERMAAQGALEEVAALVARGLDPSLPVMKAVGVAPFARHLRDEMGLDAAIAQAAAQTRRYIKRQETWARTQMVAWERIYAQEMETQMQGIFRLLSEMP